MQQVILLERVARLGNMGETVSVKPGFARNYLVPQGKALPATKANMAKYEAQKKELEAINESARKEAEKQASALEGVTATVVRQASETGQLYGSVKARDVVAALAEQKVEIEAKMVDLGEGLHEIGEFEVRVALHPEVVIQLPVKVERQSA